MNRVLPILFNTEMVRAILAGKKICTRRIIKRAIPFDSEAKFWNVLEKGEWTDLIDVDDFIKKYAPYHSGDTLYVRETWCWFPCWDCGMDTKEGCCDKEAAKIYHSSRKEYGCYAYKASFKEYEKPFDRWYPSIHMPKEVARIWLKVTDVRVERLQDITEDGAKAEGANCKNGKNVGFEEKMSRTAIDRFAEIWNGTVKKVDIGLYDWDANPWVWVIEFERCKKPEEAEKKQEEVSNGEIN